jgi:hypothetical protein
MAIYIKHGTYTGDGSGSNRAITGIGFQPKVVIVKGASSGSQIRIDSMPSGESKQFDSNVAFDTDCIVSLDSDGFTVAPNATQSNSVNYNAIVYYYIAFGGDSSDIATGTYTGNATDDRDVVTSLSFQPDMVFVTAASALALLRNSAISAATDETWYIGTTAFGTNRIQQVLSNGFQIGTNATVNSNTVAYYWFTLKSTTGVLEFGTYTGNGAATRDITGITTFQPTFAMSTCRNAVQNTTWKTSDMSSTNGFVASQNSSAVSTGIRGFLSDGFSVGSTANDNTDPYYFFAAIENAPGASSNSNFLALL